MQHTTVRRYLRAQADSQRWYALSGTRLYCIATLAGAFPDLGWHVPQEMGGVWAPPIKLLDGYWLGIRADGHTPRWLTSPTTWQRAADGVTLHYTLPALNLEIVRRDWIVPDESVLIVDVRIARMPTPSSLIAPMTLECGLALRSDLRGVWLSDERLGLRDSQDVATFDNDLGAVTFHDTQHPEWMACVGATDTAGAALTPHTYALGDSIYGPERTSGQGTGATLWYQAALGETAPYTLRFVIAGPGDAGDSASTAFSRYAHRPDVSAERAEQDDAQASADKPATALEQAHRAFVEAFATTFDTCALNSPDEALNEAFAWAKVAATDLLLEVPGLGRAPMAGLADFPWWFGCDTAFGVLPLLVAGKARDATAALRTLAAISREHNGNGRVVHEVISNGVVAAPGNLVETLLFVRALYHTYRWTGDTSLLDDIFPFCLDGVLRYALGERLRDGERVPQGESIVETPEMHGGVQTLDVGAYSVEALYLLAELADARHDEHLATELRERAEGIRRHLRDEWWMAEPGLFGDLRASRDELTAMLSRFEAIQTPDDSVLLSISRLRNALAAPDDNSPGVRRPWLFHHYIQALATEAGIPMREQAEALFARLETPEWTGPMGLALNAATDRRIMSLPTGAIAVAEARYGRTDAALGYIERLISVLGAATPGMISEYSPDGGCFQQLWSSYGVIWPIVHYFFGLRPDAAAKRIACVPQLPDTWP
ncbi:MAG TPA: hypothetical protein VJR48_15480, partial [Ktedonobacterales bacterium]|nr:hypothetical protein [Ktedonobacterales bacterium]